MRLAGVDIAWGRRSNRTAIACGELAGCRLRVRELNDGFASPAAVAGCLLGDAGLTGIAIDAPLIINNDHGQRACERRIGHEYGARKASCHASNRVLYPDAASVALAGQLARAGFEHLGDRGGRWQLECYPHPALIELFGLAERHAYKKGRVGERQRGQVGLARMLLALQGSHVLPLEVPGSVAADLSAARIADLGGRALDRNEDRLDALVCLYVAGLYAIGVDDAVFGDTRDGYIYVPRRRCA